MEIIDFIQSMGLWYKFGLYALVLVVAIYVTGPIAGKAIKGLPLPLEVGLEFILGVTSCVSIGVVISTLLYGLAQLIFGV